MRPGLIFRITFLGAAAALPGPAGEWPYFVTYSHQMEEPRNLEIATRNIVARPESGNRFLGSITELEYGVTAWWTSEFYLGGQATAGDSTLFTGYRWENRFRILPREHWINPVLYLEYERVNEADRGLLDVVGHDGQDDQLEPNAETRHEIERELEAKLILSSNFKGWNVSENFIVAKNLAHEPYEFGYAVGVSRPLALAARPDRCTFCRENLVLGVEVYGGLGTRKDFGLAGTSHYIAPTVGWHLPNGTTLRFSPGFGLTGTSLRFPLRFGISYEIAQFGRAARRWFR